MRRLATLAVLAGLAVLGGTARADTFAVVPDAPLALPGLTPNPSLVIPSDLTTVDQHDPRRWIGLAVLLTAVFVSVLDNFIVFVAIPSIRSDLGATNSQVEFVVAGYTLTFALGLITSGRMGV